VDKNDVSSPLDTPQEDKAITVREFLMASPVMDLDLEVVEGYDGLDNQIRSPRIQKLGLMLASFTGDLDPGRVVIFGNSELNYLKILDAEARKTAIRQLKKYSMCCVVVTKRLEIPTELLELSAEDKIPILRCSAVSAGVIPKITDYLERRLASEMTIHGVLIDIFGLGVLVLGPSGIGKSECALELVLKGHRLVADDYVQLTRHGINRLSGEGGKILKHHMELRGLGIINIKELFGISATGASQNIDFVVRLERWKPDADYDRLGLERSTIDFMGVSLPIINIPVAPGRNVATLIEVAARIQLLRHRGYQSSTEKLLKKDEQKPEEPE
jgi:HPr kinase/phosphorylase